MTGLTTVLRKVLLPKGYKFKQLKIQQHCKKRKRSARKHGKKIDRELTLNSDNARSGTRETKAIRKALKKRKLRIIDTQQYVHIPDSRVTTRYDLKCIHTETSQIYIVEVKYACLYRHISTEKNLQVLETLSDATIHIHQAQAMITNMFDTSNKDSKAALVYVYETQVEWIDEDDFAISREDVNLKLMPVIRSRYPIKQKKSCNSKKVQQPIKRRKK